MPVGHGIDFACRRLLMSSGVGHCEGAWSMATHDWARSLQAPFRATEIAWRIAGGKAWAAAGVLAGLLAVTIALAAPNPVSGPKRDEGYQTSASTALLLDGNGGGVLFEKSADELIAPASLSKLM